MSVPSVAQMLKTVDISMPQYVAIMAQDGGMELLATEFSKAGYPPVLPSAPTRSYLTPRAQVQPRRCIDVEAGFPSASTDRCDYNHHWCERDAKHSDLRQRDGIHSASTHGPVHELARRSLMNGLTPSHTYTYTLFELRGAVVFARHPRVPVIPGAQLFGSLNRKNLGAVVHIKSPWRGCEGASFPFLRGSTRRRVLLHCHHSLIASDYTGPFPAKDPSSFSCQLSARIPFLPSPITVSSAMDGFEHVSSAMDGQSMVSSAIEGPGMVASTMGGSDHGHESSGSVRAHAASSAMDGHSMVLSAIEGPTEVASTMGGSQCHGRVRAHTDSSAMDGHSMALSAIGGPSEVGEGPSTVSSAMEGSEHTRLRAQWMVTAWL
jgi:hypothetical protein